MSDNPFTDHVPALYDLHGVGPFVYFIQSGPFVKIGTSIHPAKRCDQLRRGGKAKRPSTWHGNPALVAYALGNVTHEQELHRRFASQRDRGEWFHLDESLAEFVEDVALGTRLKELEQFERFSLEALQQDPHYYLSPVIRTNEDRALAFQATMHDVSPLDWSWIEGEESV